MIFYLALLNLVYLPQRTFRQYCIFQWHIPFFLRDIIFQHNTNDCEYSQFDFLIWFNSFLVLVKFTLKDKKHDKTEYETLDVHQST